MPLIYFDTSNLSKLAQALERDSARFRAFQENWRRWSCELALSRAHLQELRRYPDPTVRELRYQLIEALLPARLDMLGGPLNELSDREIAVAVMRIVMRGAWPEPDRATIGFPTKLASNDDVQAMREIEDPLLGGAVELFDSALGLAASAHQRPPNTKYERPRLTEIPDLKPTAEQTRAALEAVRGELAKMPLLMQARGLVGEQRLADGQADALSILERVFARAQEVGMRSAMEEFLGVQAVGMRPREFTDVAIQRSSLKDQARRVMELSSPGRSSEEYDAIAAQVRPEDCPGIWLRNAVELEFRRAKGVGEPNDWLDGDHLSHLPYVDALFADGEASAVARSVLRRSPLPAELQGVEARLHSVPNTVDALESVVRLTAER